MDPGGFGPTSLGQLTGIRGECAAEGAKAITQLGDSPESKPINYAASPLYLRTCSTVFEACVCVRGRGNTVMSADEKGEFQVRCGG